MVTDPLDGARDLLEHRQLGALVTHLESNGKLLLGETGAVLAGELGSEMVEAIRPAALTLIGRGRSGTVSTTSGEFFVEAIVPSPRLLVFGAGPIAEALCSMAAAAGFAVEVGDPRPAFAQEARFPAAVAVRVGWPGDLVAAMAPDQASYAVSLLHDERFEAELMPALLRSPVRYIGALGSTRTHAARVDRLARDGFGEEEVDRIHGPVGLGIGAVTPEEIAVSIVAELVAVRRSAAR